MYEGYVRYLRGIPLVGGLVDCGVRDHWDAMSQTLVVLTLSTTPIWLATILLYAMSESAGFNALKSALHSTIANGELFMYSTALLAPMFWIALDDPPGAGAFPSKKSHMFLIGIIDLIASGFFALGISGRHLNPNVTFTLSTYMFYFSLILLYLGTVYHVNRMPNGAEVFKKQEGDFSISVKKHRQGKREQ
jgi:hypothetical protein